MTPKEKQRIEKVCARWLNIHAGQLGRDWDNDDLGMLNRLIQREVKRVEKRQMERVSFIVDAAELEGLREENTRLLKSMGVWEVVKRKDEEIARLKKEISDRQGTEQSLTEWVDEIATSEDKLKTELAQLQLEVGALRGAIQKAADQIKRGEWNSYNSGTWTILNDVLSTPPLSTLRLWSW